MHRRHLNSTQRNITRIIHDFAALHCNSDISLWRITVFSNCSHYMSVVSPLLPLEEYSSTSTYSPDSCVKADFTNLMLMFKEMIYSRVPPCYTCNKYFFIIMSFNQQTPQQYYKVLHGAAKSLVDWNFLNIFLI